MSCRMQVLPMTVIRGHYRRGNPLLHNTTGNYHVIHRLKLLQLHVLTLHLQVLWVLQHHC